MMSRRRIEPPEPHDSSAGHQVLFAVAAHRRHKFDEEDTKQFRSLNRAAAAARMPRPRCVGDVPSWLQDYIVPYKYMYQTQCTLPWIQVGLCCYQLRPDAIYKAYAANNLQLIQAIIDTPWNPLPPLAADRPLVHPLVGDFDRPQYFRCPGSAQMPTWNTLRCRPFDYICSIEMWHLLHTTNWLPNFGIDRENEIIKCGTASIEMRCAAVRLYLDCHFENDTIVEKIAISSLRTLTTLRSVNDARLLSLVQRFFEPYINYSTLKVIFPVMRDFTLTDRYPRLWSYIVNRAREN